MSSKWFWFLLLLMPVFNRCEIVPRPIVSIEMGDIGMHRDLLYTIKFDYPLAGKDCEYMLEQLLPAAVYVSTDQLDDLRRLKKLKAQYPKFVDIEAPTEKAKSFTVLLSGSPKASDTMKLPIHFRYHNPDDKSDFATVHITTPSLFMNCPETDADNDNDTDTDDNLNYEHLSNKPDVVYCLNENSSGFDRYDSSSAVAKNLERCNWRLMRIDYQLKTALRATIPVGNSRSYPAVLYVTIIVSWMISLWTLFRTHSVPRRINYKLNEQRVLQQKIK